MTSSATIEVTTDCPEIDCDGTDDIAVFGFDGQTVHTDVVCSTCGVTYHVAVVITAEGAATETSLT